MTVDAPDLLRFIVVADSHIRFPDDDVATYPSNALMLDRNRRVVEMCNELTPAFVVHLGDIVHPLPVEEAHEPAVKLAADVYSTLDAPVYFVPGNPVNKRSGVKLASLRRLESSRRLLPRHSAPRSVDS